MNKQITKKVVATFTSVATVAMMTAGAFMPMAAGATFTSCTASGSWSPSGAISSAGIEASPDGTSVYLSEDGGSEVRKYAASGGSPVWTTNWTSVPVPSAPSRSIMDMVQHPNGNLYAVGAGGYLFIINAATGVVGSSVMLPGFGSAFNIDVDSAGTLYVGRPGDIVKMDALGAVIGAPLPVPVGNRMGIDSLDRIWITDNSNVRVYTTGGSLIAQETYSTLGLNPGQSTRPTIAGEHGDALVVDGAGGLFRVSVSGSSLTASTQLATAGIYVNSAWRNDVALSSSTGIANVFVAGIAYPSTWTVWRYTCTPIPTPTDLCTNLPGNQATMPAGYADPDNDKVCNTTCALDALTSAGLTPASLGAHQLAVLEAQCLSDPSQVIVVPAGGAVKDGIKPNPTGTCLVIVGEGANVRGGVHCQKALYCDVIMAADSNVSGGIKDMRDVYINGTGVSVSGGIHNARSFIEWPDADLTVSGGIKGIIELFQVGARALLTASGGITCAEMVDVSRDPTAILTVSGSVACNTLVARAFPSEGSGSGNLLALAAAALAAGLGIGVYARRRA